MLFAMGLMIFSSENNVVMAKQRIHLVYRYNIKMREKYANSEINDIMQQAGIPFSLYHFQLARIVLLTSVTLFVIFKSFIDQHIFFNGFLLILIGFVLTTPKERIFGMRSVFKQLIDASEKNKKIRYNQELYLAISQLRNSFKVYGHRAPSSIEILEEIAQYTDKLKPVFHKLISFFMTGDSELAVKYFAREIDTSEAEKLGQVFMKLDSLDPIEFDDQLATFQQIYRAKRETERQKRDELKSYILFGAVLATCIVILLNYLAVGFMIDILLQTSELF